MKVRFSPVTEIATYFWNSYFATNIFTLVNFCFVFVAVDSDAANKMMDLIRDKFVNGDVSKIENDPSGIMLVGAEEFA
jgi:hypothetical protein